MESNIVLGTDRMKRTGPFNYELEVEATTRDQLQFCDRKITGGGWGNQRVRLGGRNCRGAAMSAR
jgi:hypothetical protein